MYLIANHTMESIETIQEMLNLSANELDFYRSNQSFKEEYSNELKAFYELLIPDELSGLYSRLVTFEKLENLSSEEREELAHSLSLGQ